MAAIPTEWLDNTSSPGSFDSFKENVTQTIVNLTSYKTAYSLLMQNIRILPIKQQQK